MSYQAKKPGYQTKKPYGQFLNVFTEAILPRPLDKQMLVKGQDKTPAQVAKADYPIGVDDEEQAISVRWWRSEGYLHCILSKAEVTNCHF